jgi:hypothetical protein
MNGMIPTFQQAHPCKIAAFLACQVTSSQRHRPHSEAAINTTHHVKVITSDRHSPPAHKQQQQQFQKAAINTTPYLSKINQHSPPAAVLQFGCVVLQIGSAPAPAAPYGQPHLYQQAVSVATSLYKGSSTAGLPPGLPS